MFTGLVEDIGTLEGVRASGDARVLTVRPAALPVDQLTIGESIAVDGVCLTVTERGGGIFTVLAGEETMRRTTVGEWSAGGRVNLERALQLSSRLGGHLMQGHVDRVGVIQARREDGSNVVIEVRTPPELMRYLVEKGSIAVDGISLTVTSVADYAFAIALIPHSVAATTLAGKPVGARVNLEVDMIAKYVERLLGASGASRTP